MIAAQNPLTPSTERLIPIRLKAAVRTQYLVNGVTGGALYKLFPELKPRQIIALLHRQGLTKERRKLELKSDEIMRARARAAAAELSESIAAESEELCFSALNVTRDGLTIGGLTGAKQAQAASGALRNLHQIAQAIRQPGLEQPAPDRSQLNVFVLRSPEKAPEKQAEVVEVEVKAQ